MGFMLTSINNFISRQQYHQLFLIIFLGCFGLSLIGSDFKIFTIGLIVFLGILYFKTRDMFISLFILLLITAQFQLPGKYYTFELISKSKYFFLGLPDGIIDGFGLISSDIIAFALVMFLLRQGIIAVTHGHWHLFTNIIKNIYIKGTLLCWLSYFLLSFFSSSQYSFFPVFSLTILLQYLKMPLIFICSFILLGKRPSVYKTFLYTLAALLLFQSTLGTFQVTKAIQPNSGPGGTVAVAEEDLLLPRAQGTFEYANQFGLIQLILLLFLLPYVFTGDKGVFRFSAAIGVISIVLSQSRTSWLTFVLILCIFIYQYKHRLASLLSKLPTIKPSVLLVLLFIPIIIIGTRLITSGSFFGDFGGGTLRASMIRDATTIVVDMPFAGYGLETSLYKLFETVPTGYVRYFPFAIHMGFLQMAIESGWIAMICFFLPFYFAIRQLIIKFRAKKQIPILSHSATLGLVAIFIYYCLHPIYGRVEFLYIGLLLGMSYQYNE
jgi:hypothetical protein